MRYPVSVLTACLLFTPAWAHPDHGGDLPNDVSLLHRGVAERAVTGWGAHAYATVPGWCQAPEGEHLGATHGSIAVDAEGMIYASIDSGRFGIAVYHPDGTFARGMGEGYVGTHHLTYVEEDGTGYLYGAHLAGKRVFKMTLDGEVLWALPCPMASGKYTDANQYNPTAVAVGPDGRLYVVDGYGQNWVHIYDAQQNYVASFGGRGTGDGQFQTCHGIAVDPRGDESTLLVCDRESRRLQRFTMEGEFIGVTTTGLYRPCALSFYGEYVAVAELAGRVVILDGNDQPVSVLGDNPVDSRRANFGVEPAVWEEAVFNAPHGLSFDNDGNLLVMEWNRWGRITFLEHLPESEAPEAPAVDTFAADPDTFGQWISRDATVSTSSTSQWDTPSQHAQFVQANRPEFAPDYAFHTAEQANAWVEVDLGAVHDLTAVSLWNRAGNPERAEGLVLFVSEDGENYTMAAQFEDGAAKWEARLDCSARYLRFALPDEPAYLHLKHVRVYGE